MITVVVVIAGLFAALFIVFGLWGLVQPRQLQEWIATLPTQPRFSLVVASRAVFGVSLLVAASASRFPTALLTLGWIALTVALVLTLAGPERLQSTVGWWTERSAGTIRAGSAFAAGIGVFVFYGLLA